MGHSYRFAQSKTTTLLYPRHSNHLRQNQCHFIMASRSTSSSDDLTMIEVEGLMARSCRPINADAPCDGVSVDAIPKCSLKDICY